MSRRTPKTAVVAFKVEEELAEFLNKLPNKSAFIRKAIVAQLSMACPVCRGTGVLPKGLHDHYAALLPKFNSRSCDRYVKSTALNHSTSSVASSSPKGLVEVANCREAPPQVVVLSRLALCLPIPISPPR